MTRTRILNIYIAASMTYLKGGKQRGEKARLLLLVAKSSICQRNNHKLSGKRKQKKFCGEEVNKSYISLKKRD